MSSSERIVLIISHTGPRAAGNQIEKEGETPGPQAEGGQKSHAELFDFAINGILNLLDFINDIMKLGRLSPMSAKCIPDPHTFNIPTLFL